MKSKLTTAILASASSLFLFSCSSPKEKTAGAAIDMDKLKTEIQAMEDKFAAAEKAKDAAAVASYYSDDAVSYSRNAEPVVGNAAIKDKIAADIAKDTTGNNNVYKVVDLYADGDLAVEIGSWNKMNAAGQQIDKGHYMSVFKKQSDGKYKCIRDMNVTSTPKP